MHPRLNLHEVDQDAYKAVLNLATYVNRCGLEHSLLELVKLRASQINGCAYCIDMHVKDARKAGESDQRMHLRAVQFSSCEGCAIAMRVEGAVFGLKTSLPVIGKA